MYSQTSFTLLLFFFGACLGSFLYCVAGQWVTHSFHWNKRSTCDNCHCVLQWYELFPLVSFIFFRAKCHSCFVQLSNMYFLTELVVGSLFCYMTSLMLYTISFSAYCYYFVVFVLLVCMSFCDLHDRWVPDTLQVCLLFAVLYNRGALLRSDSFYLSYWLIFILLIMLLYMIAPNWIGGADIKLMAILSGAINPLDVSYFVFLASFSGLIYLAFNSFVLKKQIESIPFIPFISISFYIVGIIRVIL